MPADVVGAGVVGMRGTGGPCFEQIVSFESFERLRELRAPWRALWERAPAARSMRPRSVAVYGRMHDVNVLAPPPAVTVQRVSTTPATGSNRGSSRPATTR